MNVKKTTKLLLSTLLASSVFFAQAAEKTSIAITQIVAHPALDDTYQGVVDTLEKSGFKDGDNAIINYEIAQGDISIATQIAKKFAGDKPDVIVAIATPSAQSIAAAVHDIPVVFAAVTDPVEAKLVSNLDAPGGNITGVSDEVAFEQHLKMIADIVPNAVKIGTIYNPGEANSVATVAKIEKFLSDKPQQLITAVATKSSEVLSAAKSLVGKVDVIYITLDNTVVTAMESVVQVGLQNKLPIFSADTDSVARGAIAALSFNYYDVGVLAGEYAVQILGGKSPATLEIAHPQQLNLVLNIASAKAMGVDIPEDIIASADKIIGE